MSIFKPADPSAPAKALPAAYNTPKTPIPSRHEPVTYASLQAAIDTAMSAQRDQEKREAFERGRYRAVVVSGAFTEERWVFGATEVHCGGCQDYAGMDWVKLGKIKAFPGDGSTECLTWCGCHKEYR